MHTNIDDFMQVLQLEETEQLKATLRAAELEVVALRESSYVSWPCMCDNIESL